MPLLLLPLLLLFAASGCAALIYEIVWFKLLQLVIGSTGISIGVLLAAYMGGLFAGSLAFPRFVDKKKHPLLVYAAIEGGIGVLGIAVILGLPVLDHWYSAHAATGFGGLLERSLLAAVCLLPPTILMGASLPAIARWLDSKPQGLAGIGFLYGANTAGACVGCVLAGFYLLRLFDMPSASFVAAGFNFAAAIASYLLAKRTPYTPAVEEPTMIAEAAPTGAAVTADSDPAWTVYVAIALSGAAALGAEVVWTRLLGLMIGATVYTFSIILAGFLVAICAGSAAGSWAVRQGWNARRALGISQFALIFGIGWCVAAMADVLPYLPINNNQDLWKGFGIDVVRIFLSVIPPALLWGASFPLALAAAARPGEETGQLSSKIYAANTFGAIFGALGFSVFFIPWVGTHRCEHFLIVLSAAAAIFALPSASRVKWGIATIAAAGVAIFVYPEVPWQVFAYGRETTIAVKDGRLLYNGEGRDASIAVSETSDGVRFYHISGKTEASTEPYDMRVERMLGHLPALVVPVPRSVLLVGCGAGITAGTFVVQPETQKIHICELERLVPKANSIYFARENNNVVKDPRTEITYDDARHFIQTTDEKFDIITSDPIAPWVRGSATLSTQEYFETCKRHLNPGGVMAHWLPFYETDPESVKSGVATFFSVFPNATIWSNDIDGEGYDSLMIGVNGDPTIDVDAMQSRLDRPDYQGVVRSMYEIGFSSAAEMLATYVGSDHDVKAWVGNAPINLDRNMRLEFLAGASLRHHMAPAILDQITEHRQFPTWLFRGAPQRLQTIRALLHGRR
jgi:spermidine synthase